MKRITRLLLPACLLGWALSGCGRPSAGFVPASSDEPLAAVVAVNQGYNVVFLQPLLGRELTADTVWTDHERLEAELSAGGHALMLRARSEMPRSATISFQCSGKRFDIAVRRNLEMEFDYTYAGTDSLGPEPVTMITQAYDWQPYSLPELSLYANGKLGVRMLNRAGLYPFYLLQDGRHIADTLFGRYVNHLSDTLGLLPVTPLVDLGPVLRSQSFNDRHIVLQALSPCGGMHAFWGNRLLPDKQFVRIGNKRVRIQLPAEADSLPLSWIRLVADNDMSTGSEMLIPLQYGKVSREVHPLPLVPVARRQPDAVLPALSGNKFTVVHTLLYYSMQRYGWHRLGVPDSAPRDQAEALFYATAPSVDAGQAPGTSPLLPQEWNEIFGHNSVLAYGDFLEWRTDPDLWIYERQYFGQSIVVVLNRLDTDCELTLPLPDHLQGRGFDALDQWAVEVGRKELKLQLPAGQCRLLRSISEEP